MKKSIYLVAIAIMLLTISSCVTKQKYMELDKQYNDCKGELSYVTSEKIDFENRAKELGSEVTQLRARVEQLAADTLTLTRRLRQSERDYAKSKKDYDDLLKEFADHNLTNNNEISRLLADIERIKTQLQERENELNRQTSELDLVSIELRDKELRLNELSAILDKKDAEVKALKDKVANALVGFEGSGLNVYEKNGKVYVSMDEKLLFTTASWEVGSEGENAIKELAKILEQDVDINVLIEGHTDNVPYRGSGQVKDNWDLSVMRSTSVVKTLLKYGQIDPKRITAAGRGEFFPIDSENTTQARAKNRRTEIILTPKLDELFKIIDSN